MDSAKKRSKGAERALGESLSLGGPLTGNTRRKRGSGGAGKSNRSGRGRKKKKEIITNCLRVSKERNWAHWGKLKLAEAPRHNGCSVAAKDPIRVDWLRAGKEWVNHSMVEQDRPFPHRGGSSLRLTREQFCQEKMLGTNVGTLFMG